MVPAVGLIALIHFSDIQLIRPQQNIVLMIEKVMRQNVEYRRKVQDWGHPSAGSIFKNPSGSDCTVGEMVDRLGLKGTQIGGAQISPIHGNFFINKGGARAQDVLDLMDLVRERVYQKFQVQLEPEIQYVSS